MNELNQLNWSRDNFDNIGKAWDGDLWGRERLGIQLTSYVDRLQCGAVLALDAKWGEGKTWFVRHWAKHLDDTNHNVIYLDAFANDYLNDPFLIIASEIATKLDKTADKGLVHKFKKAAAVMQQGLLTIAPTLIASMISCAITGGIIPFIKIDSEKIADKLDDAIDKVTDNIGEKVTEAIQNKIEAYEEEKNSLLAFKITLAELAKSLDKPLVFIIDELDRCRPDFSIRLIERIKHFFDIKNIVFVLVMDKNQFSKTVCHNYGYDEKVGEEYLDKFIDFSLKLNPIKNENLLDFVRCKLINIGVEIKSPEFKNIDFLICFMAKNCETSSRELLKIIYTFNLLILNDANKNSILIIYLFLKKHLVIQSDTVELYSFIVNWFKSIVENTEYLKEHLQYKIQDMQRTQRIYSKHQLYGQILYDVEDIYIASVLMRYFDEYEKRNDGDDFLHQRNFMPFSDQQDGETVNFKRQWEFYISSGLSI